MRSRRSSRASATRRSVRASSVSCPRCRRSRSRTPQPMASPALALTAGQGNVWAQPAGKKNEQPRGNADNQRGDRPFRSWSREAPQGATPNSVESYQISPRDAVRRGRRKVLNQADNSPARLDDESRRAGCRLVRAPKPRARRGHLRYRGTDAGPGTSDGGWTGNTGGRGWRWSLRWWSG